jgi:hypothetical protein
VLVQGQFTNEDWKVVFSLFWQQLQTSTIASSTTTLPALSTSTPTSTPVSLLKSLPTIKQVVSLNSILKNSLSQMLYKYDETSNKTYFIVNLEVRMFLVLVYIGKMEITDQQVNEFIKQMLSSVHLVPLFENMGQ